MHTVMGAVFQLVCSVVE